MDMKKNKFLFGILDQPIIFVQKDFSFRAQPP